MTSSRSFEAKASHFRARVSGPGVLSLAVVEKLHPKPFWADTRTFVEPFRAMPLLQLLCGVVLLFGFIAIATSVPASARIEEPSMGSSLVAFVTIVAALVTLACLD